MMKRRLREGGEIVLPMSMFSRIIPKKPTLITKYLPTPVHLI